jgi:hypothetical protein
MLLISLASAYVEAFASPAARPVLVARRCIGGATILFTSIDFWAGMTAGIAVEVAALVIARHRIRAARREASDAKTAAERLDYERDLAQQALVQKLEQERELSKEKMQFESQLTTPCATRPTSCMAPAPWRSPDSSSIV